MESTLVISYNPNVLTGIQIERLEEGFKKDFRSLIKHIEFHKDKTSNIISYDTFHFDLEKTSSFLQSCVDAWISAFKIGAGL